MPWCTKFQLKVLEQNRTFQTSHQPGRPVFPRQFLCTGTTKGENDTKALGKNDTLSVMMLQSVKTTAKLCISV